MKLMLILITCLFLSSCFSITITDEDINAAEQVCSNHGGLSRFWLPGPLDRRHKAQCVDGLTILYTKKEGVK